MSNRDNGFRSQAEAIREARLSVWGDVPLSKRECILPEPGTFGVHVAALVNGRLVLVTFDNFGRTGNGVRPVKVLA